MEPSCFLQQFMHLAAINQLQVLNKPRPTEISHYFFVITPALDISLLFLLIPRISTIYFFQYPRNSISSTPLLGFFLEQPIISLLASQLGSQVAIARYHIQLSQLATFFIFCLIKIFRLTLVTMKLILVKCNLLSKVIHGLVGITSP